VQAELPIAIARSPLGGRELERVAKSRLTTGSDATVLEVQYRL